MRPMTDFGLAERFLERHGDRFRFTTAKGWLGWDDRRWKVLDQDKETLPAELIAAVFETIRDVQREARRIAETGLKLELVEARASSRSSRSTIRTRMRWTIGCWSEGSGSVSRPCSRRGGGSASRRASRRRSPTWRAACRACNGRSGRWLTVPIEEFDREKMAINVLNGTLRCRRRDDARRDEEGARAARQAQARGSADPGRGRRIRSGGACPLYDAMLAWAQPEPAMRRYLHQAGGYACTGDTGEHKLWYPLGRRPQRQVDDDRQLVLGAGRLFRHDRDRELPRPGHQEARRPGHARPRQAGRDPAAARVRAGRRFQAQRRPDQGR
jgi:phage/plasmid-associated DNA primase